MGVDPAEYERRLTASEATGRAEILDPRTALPVAPPWTMADCRREIDRVIATEERRGTPFVRAIGAALRNEVERRVLSAAQIRGVVASLEAYEAARGGAREPLTGCTRAALRAYHGAVPGERDYGPDGAVLRYEQERSR